MHQHGGAIYDHKNVLDFSSNTNLLGIPEGVVRAACEGVTLSYRYPDTQCFGLRQAISKVEQIPMEQIICGNGAADLIFSLVRSIKPRKALIPIPSFYEYEQALRMVECEIVYHNMKGEDGFSLREDFLEAMTDEVDVIFLCNPNNPTGHLIQREFMEVILRRCEDYDILLVVDECFMDFVSASKQHTIKDLCIKSKHLFVLKAFTKLYAMPGLRLGYGFCNQIELLNKMKEMSQPWNVSIPAQMAGIAALKEEEYVRLSLELLKQERTYLKREMEKLRFKIYGSKANYIFFRAKRGLYEACLEKGFLIRDCSNYKGLEAGYYRIVVKTHEENEKLIETFREEI